VSDFPGADDVSLPDAPAYFKGYIYEYGTTGQPSR
jgi:hypothetical protein